MACTPERRLADITTQVNTVLHPALAPAPTPNTEHPRSRRRKHSNTLIHAPLFPAVFAFLMLVVVVVSCLCETASYPFRSRITVKRPQH